MSSTLYQLASGSESALYAQATDVGFDDDSVYANDSIVHQNWQLQQQYLQQQRPQKQNSNELSIQGQSIWQHQIQEQQLQLQQQQQCFIMNSETQLRNEIKELFQDDPMTSMMSSFPVSSSSYATNCIADPEASSSSFIEPLHVDLPTGTDSSIFTTKGALDNYAYYSEGSFVTPFDEHARQDSIESTGSMLSPLSSQPSLYKSTAATATAATTAVAAPEHVYARTAPFVADLKDISVYMSEPALDSLDSSVASAVLNSGVIVAGSFSENIDSYFEFPRCFENTGKHDEQVFPSAVVASASSETINNGQDYFGCGNELSPVFSSENSLERSESISSLASGPVTIKSICPDSSPSKVKELSKVRKGGKKSLSTGPMPASPAALIRKNEAGIDWICFEYSKAKLKAQYSIRCDIEHVDPDQFTEEFRKENCVYPRATVDASEYTGKRQKYETECNYVGWCLSYLNHGIRGQRGLIQRAVDSWRNTRSNPEYRSRRVRRMSKRNDANDAAALKTAADLSDSKQHKNRQRQQLCESPRRHRSKKTNV